jgi:hypothetical protein
VVEEPPAPEVQPVAAQVHAPAPTPPAAPAPSRRRT